MYLDCTCTEINTDKWNELMKGARPMSYEWLKRRVKKHLPELYNSLCMDFYNPWESNTQRTKTHYILVHSAIEYFIKK